MVLGVVLVGAAFATALGTAGLVGYLRRYRGKPGADWFLASLTCQAVWGVCYGVALLVAAPVVRWVLEAVMLGVLVGIGLYFFAFALEYTGRARIPRRTLAPAIALSPLATGATVATNPAHHLFWRNYRVDAVAGLVTVDYALEPISLALATAVVALPLVGSLLLLDTVVSYGPLYRGEAVAVGLSTLPPAAALVVWLYGIGPYPQVNFVAVAFLPHVALDAYAFVGSDMFEFHPATRRAGERAAIDDLGSPVVVTDERGRVVTLNGAAQRVLGVEKETALTDPLDDHVDADDVDPGAGTQQVTVETGPAPRTFSVTSTPLEAGGDRLGYTLVWQDVTEELRREQRLEVLNRVLRHNLRNDMAVIRGFADAARDAAGDEEVAGMLETAVEKSDELVGLGETARDVERVLSEDPRPEPVDLGALLADVVGEAREADSGAALDLDCPDVTVEADRKTLRAVCAELVENAVDHAGPDPSVGVTVEGGDPVVVRVTDDGPGLPETELAVIEAGEETQLEHGSGLGLWLVRWGTERLGADLTFETSDSGTTVALSLPRSRPGTEDT